MTLPWPDVRRDGLEEQPMKPVQWTSPAVASGGAVLTGEAQTNDLLRREAVRQASASGTGGSPPALEATLASISAEVTAEAIERLSRAPKPKQPTG